MFTKVVRISLVLSILALAFVVVPYAFAGDEACGTRVNNTFAKLLECVTLDGVRAHQAAFQAIADSTASQGRHTLMLGIIRSVGICSTG